MYIWLKRKTKFCKPQGEFGNFQFKFRYNLLCTSEYVIDLLNALLHLFHLSCKKNQWLSGLEGWWGGGGGFFDLGNMGEIQGCVWIFGGITQYMQYHTFEQKKKDLKTIERSSLFKVHVFIRQHLISSVGLAQHFAQHNSSRGEVRLKALACNQVLKQAAGVVNVPIIYANHCLYSVIWLASFVQVTLIGVSENCNICVNTCL